MVASDGIRGGQQQHGGDTKRKKIGDGRDGFS